MIAHRMKHGNHLYCKLLHSYPGFPDFYVMLADFVLITSYNELEFYSHTIGSALCSFLVNFIVMFEYLF